MKRRTWYVWDEMDQELCTGSHAKCLSYYKRHGGTKAGLHLGYWL